MKSNIEMRWGIIGCGDVCEIKSGPAFNKVDHSTLVAVMRRDGAKAKDYAVRHQVPKFYNDANQLIADPDINAIYIATPPASHEAYAIASMQAGKPVYIEKPITLNSQSCQRMIKASNKYRVPVSVAHYRRGLPIFKKIKSLITSGAVGKVRLILVRNLQAPSSKIKAEENWRIDPAVSGGGLFHDLSPHQLDIFYWIFGIPKDIHGRSLNQGQHYNAPDVTTIDAIYPNNVLLRGIWAFNVSNAAEEETCEIIGDEGKITFAFFRKSDIHFQHTSGDERMAFDYPVNIQQPMIDEVVKYFRGEGPNPCSLEDSLVTMKMIDSTL
ncbi:MAG: Gfo/Idh/MocA family oxidoreductase [Cyclobacteriaceae bacterium]